MQKRNVLNSPRLLELKRHRRRIILNKILLSLLAFLVIFALAAYISRIPSLNISEVKITGHKSVDAEIIKTAAQKEIIGNYLWFFPKTNILFYPENNLKKELQNQFKKLKDISFSIKDGKTLEISITERIASYIWCGVNLVVGLPSNSDSTTEGEKCYFVDEAGYIFEEAPYFSGEVYFKFYGLADIGTYFLKENFKQLIYFKNTLVAMGLKPVSLYIEDNGDIKVFLSAFNKTPTTGPEIVLKISSDFKTVAENLETALGTEPLLSSLKNKYSSLEYIDLRFGNKLFYKI